MKIFFIFRLFFGLLFIVFFYSDLIFAAQSDCPVQLALTDTSGNSITTAVDYEVHFYSASTAGTELITAETGTSTPSSGLLRIPLSCDATLISNPNIFLEFIINGETLTPRVEMAASPFAATAFSVAGNSITLGTDTVGNYIQSLTAGTGINITGTSGEGAALTISATGGLSTGSVTTTEILDGTIATSDLADSSITSSKIALDTITAADIAADAVDSTEIATGAVTTTEILDGTIASADIGNSQITSTQLANNSVSTSKIIDGSIQLADLTNGSSLPSNFSIEAGDYSLTLNHTGATNSAFAVINTSGNLNPIASEPLVNFTQTRADNGPILELNLTTEATTYDRGPLVINSTQVGNTAPLILVNDVDAGADASSFAVYHGKTVAIGIDPSIANTRNFEGMRVEPPPAQAISNGNTISADSCGSIKRISSAGAVTTDTTNTFTAPSVANAGCCMDVINVGLSNITLDNNTNFKTIGGADITLSATNVVRVCSMGATTSFGVDAGYWFQVSATAAVQ